LDFEKDIIIDCGGSEYKLSKNDGFPIYSIHMMDSRIRFYDKNLIVKCWIASNAFYNLFITHTKAHKTNKITCRHFMIGPNEAINK
jgi:hypothetical protein